MVPLHLGSDFRPHACVTGCAVASQFMHRTDFGAAKHAAWTHPSSQSVQQVSLRARRCRQAKLDALSGLAAAAEAYGAGAMAQHWPGVCRALRREILAAAAPSLDSGSRDAELEDAATRCLRLCVAANGR